MTPITWVLIIWSSYGGFTEPMVMPSKEACLAAAKNIDDKTTSVYTGCLNKETGEFITK